VRRKIEKGRSREVQSLFPIPFHMLSTKPGNQQKATQENHSQSGKPELFLPNFYITIYIRDVLQRFTIAYPGGLSKQISEHGTPYIDPWPITMI